MLRLLKFLFFGKNLNLLTTNSSFLLLAISNLESGNEPSIPFGRKETRKKELIALKI